MLNYSAFLEIDSILSNKLILNLNLDKLISNWHEHNLLTTTDVNNYLAQMAESLLLQNRSAYTFPRKVTGDSWTEADALYLASTGVKSLANRIKKALI